MNFDLVVIGGSLGGAKALARIIGELPADLPACLAVVLHTHEDSARAWAQILGKQTRLRVAYAEDGDLPRRGSVFLAPPGSHLVVSSDRSFALDHGPKVNHSRPAADMLFRSAAKTLTNRVIGLVLSGGDGDGTEGLKEIKRQGGVSLVQSPVDAEARSMPSTALVHDSPDFVVLTDDIAPTLRALLEERRATRAH